MLEKKATDKWVVVRDPNDNEVRIVPVKFRRYYVHTNPKWEFVAKGELDKLRQICRLIGGERELDGIDNKGQEYDGFSYHPGEFETPDTDE